MNLVRVNSTLAHLPSHSSSVSKASEDFSDQDHSDARKWLASFTANTIPQKLGEVSFSKSSGPGGQNVNKYTLPPRDYPSRGRLMFSRVNTKATVRFHMQDLTSIIPPVLHSQLRASTYYAERSNSLIIHADGSRNQNDNIRECFHKLQLLIKASGKAAVKGETSPEQAAKVKNLQRRANEARLRAKKSHSSKKSARTGKD
ncbi:hypothetical protein MMC22_000656 [Lobaria immixta]|nr:hypothetical protein [Lobaria immixta]